MMLFVIDNRQHNTTDKSKTSSTNICLPINKHQQVNYSTTNNQIAIIMDIDRLNRISQQTSSSTNLVTYILAKGQNLTLARRKLDSEISSAQNVKDKNTRQGVISSLQRVQEQLGQLRAEDVNLASQYGIAVFAG
jgi:hypothetical protein